MIELILHIGMNKCASTTLQQDVFKHEPGYLGKFIGSDISLDMGKQFQRFAPVGGRQIADINGVKNWVEKVIKEAKVNIPSVRRFIISSESLCQSNKLSIRPIIPFLQTINKDVFGHERIKVIIVFRNQADMLASDYAQNSGVQYKSSQIDFENWVENRMNGAGNTQLDWGGWAQDLIHSFGKDNVCILLLEEIQLLSFWNTLINFIDAKKLDADELHKKITSTKRNKKSIDEKTWSLNSFDLQGKAEIDVNKLYNFLWSSAKFKTWRCIFLEKSITARKKHLEIMGYKDGFMSGEKIFLNSKLRSEIQLNFEESNKILADIIDKDLKKLGY